MSCLGFKILEIFCVLINTFVFMLLLFFKYRNGPSYNPACVCVFCYSLQEWNFLSVLLKHELQHILALIIDLVLENSKSFNKKTWNISEVCSKILWLLSTPTQFHPYLIWVDFCCFPSSSFVSIHTQHLHMPVGFIIDALRCYDRIVLAVLFLLFEHRANKYTPNYLHHTVISGCWYCDVPLS